LSYGEQTFEAILRSLSVVQISLNRNKTEEFSNKVSNNNLKYSGTHTDIINLVLRVLSYPSLSPPYGWVRENPGNEVVTSFIDINEPTRGALLKRTPVGSRNKRFFVSFFTHLNNNSEYRYT